MDCAIFLLLQVGGMALAKLRATVMSERDSMTLRSYEVLMRFIDTNCDAFAEHSVDEQPANFAARAWPLLRECLTRQDNYYLSYSELLLVCEVRRQNLAIFGTHDHSLVYLGASIHDEQSAIRGVTLQGFSGRGRFRGHFQRLILAENFDGIRDKWARDALRYLSLARSRISMLHYLSSLHGCLHATGPDCFTGRSQDITECYHS